MTSHELRLTAHNLRTIARRPDLPRGLDRLLDDHAAVCQHAADTLDGRPAAQRHPLDLRATSPAGS